MDVIIHTQVYNGEKTLRRTIESVLKQTYTDFLYYISDNASTDGTVDIIKEYAAKDKRIIPGYNETNEFYAYHDNVRHCCHKHPDGYWAMLDADDEYVPEFLEKMLAFINEYDLEIAACGFTAINEESGQIIGERTLPENMILTDEAFCEDFSKYHTFMRNVCAKLFSLKLLSKCTFETVKRMPSYGGDTIFATEAFGNAKRVGIIEGSLHNVYYLPTSISTKWEPNRADSIHIRDDFTREFLIKKCGTVSPKNENFLHGVYFGSVTESLPILFNPLLDMGFSARTGYMKDILLHEKTQELLKAYAKESILDEKLRLPVVDWLLSQEDCKTQDGAEQAADILFAMYPRLTDLTGRDEVIRLILYSPQIVIQILTEYSNLSL